MFRTIIQSFSDESWFQDVAVNLRGLEATIESFSSRHVTSDINRVAWALKALTLTDLTTLSGDDCWSNVERLCIRACYPFSKNGFIDMGGLQVAAVCVYPSMVKYAHDALSRHNMLGKIQIASGELHNHCS